MRAADAIDLVLGLSERGRAVQTQRWLRECNAVGARPRLLGKPQLVNGGRLEIGDDFVMSSSPVQSHLIVGAGGVARIGHRVRIEFGAALSCQNGLEIEDDVIIGPFVMIMDSDFHVAGDAETAPEAKAVRIGARARIGHRAVILPGSQIGADAVVEPCAVVSGHVAAGARVSGNPARPVGATLSPPESGVELSVPELVQRTLGLAELPDEASGPSNIPQWDSLGALRLILALEEAYEITLSEEELKAVTSVGALSALVDRARRRQAAAVL